MKEDIEYIHRKYGKHPALLRALPRQRVPDPAVPLRPSPVFYVYDSYHIPSVAWGQLLGPLGRMSIRGTRLDGVFIGLWLAAQDGREIVKGGFDGAYTYFASGETTGESNAGLARDSIAPTRVCLHTSSSSLLLLLVPVMVSRALQRFPMP